MEIIRETIKILKDSNIQTNLKSISESIVTFEDETILGMCKIYDSSKKLIDNWRKDQDLFFTENAISLRNSSKKAWNIYIVLLTNDSAESEDELLQIEEDFVGARKIARANIVSYQSLVDALLPILPIQNKVVLETNKSLQELKARLELSEAAFNELINDDTDINQILSEIIKDIFNKNQ